MSGRTKAKRPRAESGNTSASAEPMSSTERVSYIRAFRVRDWMRMAGGMRPLVGYPTISVSRNRGQRPS